MHGALRFLIDIWTPCPLKIEEVCLSEHPAELQGTVTPEGHCIMHADTRNCDPRRTLQNSYGHLKVTEEFIQT